MSLISMPAEILQRVSFFVVKADLLSKPPRDLWALCMSCRHLYEVFLPSLYTRVDTSCSDISLLFRSIVGRPDLALLVKEFSVVSQPHRYNIKEAYTLLNKPSLLSQHGIRWLRPDDFDTIYMLLIELLLLRLVKVDDLLIEPAAVLSNTSIFAHTRWETDSAPFTSPLLPAMKELTICSDEEANQLLRLTKVQHLLNLTKPRRIYIELDCPLQTQPIPLSLPSVRALDISCESAKGDSLRNLLEACSNLESFSYHDDDGWTEWRDLGIVPVTVHEVAEILEIHQSTLKQLTLGLTKNSRDRLICCSELIPNLTQFSSLKYLQLDFGSRTHLERRRMLDPDGIKAVEFLHKFPSSLKRITIQQGDNRYTSELFTLAVRKSSEFPHLEAITLSSWRGSSDTSIDHLERELAKVDIQLIREQ